MGAFKLNSSDHYGHRGTKAGQIVRKFTDLELLFFSKKVY